VAGCDVCNARIVFVNHGRTAHTSLAGMGGGLRRPAAAALAKAAMVSAKQAEKSGLKQRLVRLPLGHPGGEIPGVSHKKFATVVA